MLLISISVREITERKKNRIRLEDIGLVQQAVLIGNVIWEFENGIPSIPGTFVRC